MYLQAFASTANVTVGALDGVATFGDPVPFEGDRTPFFLGSLENDGLQILATGESIAVYGVYAVRNRDAVHA